MKRLNTLIVLLFLCMVSTAQSLWQNPITGTDPGLQNPFTSGDVTVAEVTVSGIGRGSGISGRATNNRYNSAGWNFTNLDGSGYFTFTLTPTSGQYIHFANLLLTFQRSATGPTSFEFRSSLDGFAGAISSGSLSTNGEINIPLTDASFWNVASGIEFRLYAWDASSSSGTFSVNDFQFNGTVSNTLPVTFGNIEASKQANKINIQWVSLTETNNDYFEVQLSRNGVDFKTIKTIQSKNGNSKIAEHYDTTISISETTILFGLPFLFILFFSFVWRKKSTCSSLFAIMIISSVGMGWSCTKSNAGLQETESDQLFVRIKQVDKDGSPTYSKVVKVINR